MNLDRLFLQQQDVLRDRPAVQQLDDVLQLAELQTLLLARQNVLAQRLLQQVCACTR